MRSEQFRRTPSAVANSCRVVDSRTCRHSPRRTGYASRMGVGPAQAVETLCQAGRSLDRTPRPSRYGEHLNGIQEIVGSIPSAPPIFLTIQLQIFLVQRVIVVSCFFLLMSAGDEPWKLAARVLIGSLERRHLGDVMVTSGCRRCHARPCLLSGNEGSKHAYRNRADRKSSIVPGRRLPHSRFSSRTVDGSAHSNGARGGA